MCTGIKIIFWTLSETDEIQWTGGNLVINSGLFTFQDYLTKSVPMNEVRTVVKGIFSVFKGLPLVPNDSSLSLVVFTTHLYPTSRSGKVCPRRSTKVGQGFVVRTPKGTSRITSWNPKCGRRTERLWSKVGEKCHWEREESFESSLSLIDSEEGGGTR